MWTFLRFVCSKYYKLLVVCSNKSIISQPTTATVPPAATAAAAAVEQLPVETDFDLPKKKKRKRANVTFEGFDKAIITIILDEEGEGGEEGKDYEPMVPVDNSPWAGSNRDYTYEEVG